MNPTLLKNNVPLMGQGQMLHRCPAWFLMGTHKQQCGKQGKDHQKHELFLEMPDGNVFRFEWEIVDKKKLTRI